MNLFTESPYDRFQDPTITAPENMLLPVLADVLGTGAAAEDGESFPGWLSEIAEDGTERAVIIGADGMTVYHTDGTVLTTITDGVFELEVLLAML